MKGGDERPVAELPEELPEGKAEDVEPGVAAEDGIGGAEGLALAEQEVPVPLSGGASADGVGNEEDEGAEDEVEVAAGEVLHDLGHALAEGALFLIPEGAMGEAAREFDISEHNEEEDSAEEEAEAELGLQYAPEDPGEADVEMEPEPVSVEMEKAGQQPDDEQDGNGQERPAQDAAPEAPASEVCAYDSHTRVSCIR